jgi:hypothetical protein
MTEFQLHDTTGVCRDCGRDYPTKCFALRTADNPVRGFCPECQVLDDQRIAKLKQPPKSYGKAPKAAEPERRTHPPRRTTERRTWEQDH